MAKRTVADARKILDTLGKAWPEVAPSEALRRRAERLLMLHSLRAADALQLAAALVWSRDEGTGHSFVSLDERLRVAVAAEGFQLHPE